MYNTLMKNIVCICTYNLCMCIINFDSVIFNFYIDR